MLFQKGQIANPTGRNGHPRGWQRYGTRAQYWMENMTYGELRDIANAPAGFDRFSFWDSVILQHIWAAMYDRRERELLLDRTIGKPKRPPRQKRSTGAASGSGEDDDDLPPYLR